MTDEVAVVYVYPNDIDPADLFSETELDEHLNGAGNPFDSFWNEVSHGRYQFEFELFHAEQQVTSSQLFSAAIGYQAQGQAAFVSQVLADLLPGGLVVPHLNPNGFDRLILLLGVEESTAVHFAGGGSKSGILNVGGTPYSVPLASLPYPSLKDAAGEQEHHEFSFLPHYKSFTHWQSEEPITYPELGLWKEDPRLLHEWVHTMGQASHANFYASASEPLEDLIPPAVPDAEGIDYGNLFDVMGRRTYGLHMNAYYQRKLGFLADNEIELVDQSQAVRLVPLGLPVIHGNDRRAAVIAPPGYAHDRFYVEYRRGIGFDRHLDHPYLRGNTQGLMINLVKPGEGSPEQVAWLLDMSPDGSDVDRHEATLNEGFEYSHAGYGIRIHDVRVFADGGVIFRVDLDATGGITTTGVTQTGFAGDVSGDGTSIWAVWAHDDPAVPTEVQVFRGGTWTTLPDAAPTNTAVAVDVAPNGTTYVIDGAGEAHFATDTSDLANISWQHLPAGGNGWPITPVQDVGATDDVVYFVTEKHAHPSFDGASGIDLTDGPYEGFDFQNYWIYRLDLVQDKWERLDGGAVRLDVDRFGRPWAVTAQGGLYHLSTDLPTPGSQWAQVTASEVVDVDAGVLSSNQVAVIDGDGEFLMYRQYGTGWAPFEFPYVNTGIFGTKGLGNRIGMFPFTSMDVGGVPYKSAYDTPFVIKPVGEIFFWGRNPWGWIWSGVVK